MDQTHKGQEKKKAMLSKVEMQTDRKEKRKSRLEKYLQKSSLLGKE